MDLTILYKIYQDNSEYTTLLLSTGLLGLFFFGQLQNLLLNSLIVGILAHESLILLTMKEENESGVDLATNSVYSKIILKKYIIFTQIILVEQFLGWIWGAGFIILLLNIFKIACLLLTLQGDNSFLIVNDRVISPLFRKYETTLNKYVDKLRDRANKLQHNNDKTVSSINSYNIIELVSYLYQKFKPIVKKIQ